jgi:saccharopine dehydrogenase-like NADP-dependent oxidoreductase
MLHGSVPILFDREKEQFMATAVCLGAGMVGRLIAADLARERGVSVLAADRSDASLAAARALAERMGVEIETTVADLSDQQEIERLVQDADVVCGALASHLGYRALETVARAGKNYVDISFMAEDALDADALATEHGACAVVDMGVAPGMSNLLAGELARELSPCERLRIFVGGLPKERRWPFEYKAGFAPADVIVEYTRPARLVEHGEVVIREALSEPEPISFSGLGTLEAFNTDGLRSLATTLDVPDMAEKTLRYPGHIELMRVMRETGLFSKEPIEVGGQRVVPLEVTSALLFPKWTYEEGEVDLTVMRIFGEARGTRVQWDVYDEADLTVGASSMARTTAFPAAIVARMLLDGTIEEPGVHAPEALAGNMLVVERLIRELGDRGVRYERSERTL